MDFLTSKIKPMYFKYLAAAFGSALISSVYGVVDMDMVGQYQGPNGTAALAVVSPVWNIIYSLGLLMGIGGSVLFLHYGENQNKTAKGPMGISLLRYRRRLNLSSACCGGSRRNLVLYAAY